MTSGALFLAGSANLINLTNDIYENNKNEYQEEIDEYNEEISSYAQEVKKLNLSDIQIFMKMMDDMWKSIKGYGTPSRDVMFFEELAFSGGSGQGVCRQMASDIAKKLNEIDPKYNARTIAVLMGHDGEYKIAEIERTIIKSNKTVVESTTVKEDKITQIGYEIVENILGNHLVTVVDIPEENVTLILDPTNPGIGVYKNGKITMFNSEKQNGAKVVAKEYSNIVTRRGGVQTVKDYIHSYTKSTLSMEELEEKYGLEAQNKALNEVRAMEIVNNNIDCDNEFLSRLRVSDTNLQEQKENREQVSEKKEETIRDVEER